MSIIFNHLYIISKGLCDLKTHYYQNYQTGQTSRRVAVSVLILYAKYKVYVITNLLAGRLVRD